MAQYQTVIHWFRRDLRLTDNTALSAAVAASNEVVPLYVISDWKREHAWTGPGRQAFLSGCLDSLANNIEHVGGALVFRRGEAERVIHQLCRETGAEAVFFNRDPDPYGQSVERALEEACSEIGVELRNFKDVVLHEPGEVLTGSGDPYRVYTPYSRSWFGTHKSEMVSTVKALTSPKGISSEAIPTPESWGMNFSGELVRAPGEKAARERLKAAIANVVGEYEEMRNDPAADATSHLGADLRYGTLSAREVFFRAERAKRAAGEAGTRKSIEDFQKQLAWREFFMAILANYPEVLDQEFSPVWRGLAWDNPETEDRFERWKAGRTGFPIVDAGMRQLAETGYMHNRVRMITAMFLTKDLHIDWRLGERHFMKLLLDGEIANNNGGWQWSAGTGADAAPYFRIQNPWTQTKRYDPSGEYIKRWVPELEGVAPKQFQEAPAAGEKLVPDYVAPIVDHKTEREVTLDRFKRHRELKGAG
ncbi:MAG: deoxyribodipyrimidine photo-lyase [Verrucomicrobiota bacterium]